MTPTLPPETPAGPASSDVLDNLTCDPSITWTTGNIAEAFPGVFSTFGYTFFEEQMELAFRRTFYRLGVFPASAISMPDRIEDRFSTVFAGRGAGNVDMFRRIATVMPGTSATKIEEQLFGNAREDTVNQSSPRRIPFILARAPITLLTLTKRHDRMFAGLRTWRVEQLARVPGLDEAGCAALITDARERFGAIMAEQMMVRMLSSSLAERVGKVVADLGRPDLEAPLLSGVGSDENEVAHDLWALAHGQLSQTEFTDRHGYHGPGEGQLHGVVWREDMSQILARLEDYRAIAADSPRAPRNRSAEQQRVRKRAAAEVIAAAGPLRGRAIATLLRITTRFMALCEQGKAGYLITYDVARAAARRLGDLLVARAVIAEREDVFHLECDVLLAGVTGDQRAVVAERRALYEERQEQRLPMTWQGVPEVTKAAPDADHDAAMGTVVTGLAASGGVVSGRARVVRDPAVVELDDGDILVCETTDPSWVSLFLVAGAVVTDHGGMLSHGPIVARELGIPCVCGTGDGSHRLRDGQQIRVDGDKGLVEVIA
ncbi:MAG TPA: PEP-utilizing enzyme [Pseudonocardia sp.]|jgi:pyruvate,water dikinase|nr:PEP-utilizing enzyme [Pseudonocardia sp.]